MSGVPHSMHAGQAPGVSVSERGRALRVASGGPHLVSMGGGRLSTAVTIHPLEEGRVTLGSAPESDVVLSGTGVSSHHCYIDICGGNVTLFPATQALTAVDGLTITEPTRLTQGSMLTIGRTNYLRFNNPAEARMMKSVLPDSNSRISMAPINFSSNSNLLDKSLQSGNTDVEHYDFESESMESFHDKSRKKPPVAPRKYLHDENFISDEYMTGNILAKVSKYEYLSGNGIFKNGYVSPKVFASDSITVNTPAKDVLGKNINSFTKNLTQSAVNYSENSKQTVDKHMPFESIKTNHNYCNVAIPQNKNNRVVLHENNIHNSYVNISLNNTENSDQLSVNRSTVGSNPSLRFPNSGNTSKDNINVINNLPDSSHVFHAVPLSSASVNKRTASVFNKQINNQNYNCQNAKVATPSPSFNRNPQSSPKPCSVSQSQEPYNTQDGASESQRQRAQLERMREQENERVEQARLEEILMMCAEYEKQNANQSTKPTGPNRIKTNGSLPRDKKSPFCTSPSYNENTAFSFDVKSPDPKMNTKTLSAYENCSLKNDFYRSGYENVHVNNDNAQPFVIVKPPQSSDNDFIVGSPYENVYLTANRPLVYPNSPRTRIKTCVGQKKTDGFGDYDAGEQFKSSDLKLLDVNSLSEIKFIDSSDDGSDTKQDPSTDTDTKTKDTKASETSIDLLKAERQKALDEIRKIKTQVADFSSQEEEVLRELDMEKALLTAEYDSEKALLITDEQSKLLLVDKVRSLEHNREKVRSAQEHKQTMCKDKISYTKEKVQRLERIAHKGLCDADIREQLNIARDALENERKLYEDLEFQYLEEEADWLAYREELHNEVAELTQQIDDRKSHLLILEAQKTDMLNFSCKQTKALEHNKLASLRDLEVNRNVLKDIDLKLVQNGHKISELSSDLESEDEVFNNKISDNSIMSMSLFGTDFDKNWTTNVKSDIMSMSMNENMFHNNLEFGRLTSTPKRANNLLSEETSIKHCDTIPRVTQSNKENAVKASFPVKISDKSKNCQRLPIINIEISPKIEQLTPDAFPSLHTSTPTLLQNFGSELQSFDFSNAILSPGNLSPSARVPSQDDIDRISRVTSEAPLCAPNGGAKAEQSLREIERNRQLHLQQQGSQVIEQERQRVSELKLRVQSKVRAEWEQNHKTNSVEQCDSQNENETKNSDSKESAESDLINTLEVPENNNSTVVVVKRKDIASIESEIKDERGHSVCSVESQQSIEGNLDCLSNESVRDSTLQLQSKGEDMSLSHSVSPNDTSQIRSSADHSDSFRPLSDASDLSYDTMSPASGCDSSLDLRPDIGIKHRSRYNKLPKHQRPLTRYLPIMSENLDLRNHILSAGHQLDQCPHVMVDSTSCRGYLHKLGAKWHGWSKRWFLFDRVQRALIYYADKSEKKPRGGAYFQAIDEVYLDHSVAAHNTFIVKTRQRMYRLLAPSSPAARIWIDSICTGAMGNMAYDM